MNTIVRSCMDTVRESALELDWEKNPLLHWRLGPASVSLQAFSRTLYQLSYPHLDVSTRVCRQDVIGLVSGDWIVQELCERRGGHPGLSILTSLLVSVAVKNY